MKRSKFTESQIVFALKQAETGVAVAEVCRKMGISEATFYNWKKKYGGLGPDELRRLRQLEEENSRLKQIVADLTLDKQMLQDVLKKSFKEQTAPAAGRKVTGGLSGVGATGLRGGVVVALGALLRRTSPRRPGGEATDQRDGGDAGEIWISANTDPVATGRLARQSQADSPYLQGRRT
jgi:putative transposase